MPTVLFRSPTLNALLACLALAGLLACEDDRTLPIFVNGFAALELQVGQSKSVAVTLSEPSPGKFIVVVEGTAYSSIVEVAYGTLKNSAVLLTYDKGVQSQSVTVTGLKEGKTTVTFRARSGTSNIQPLNVTVKAASTDGGPDKGTTDLGKPDAGKDKGTTDLGKPDAGKDKSTLDLGKPDAGKDLAPIDLPGPKEGIIE